MGDGVAKAKSLRCVGSFQSLNEDVEEALDGPRLERVAALFAPLVQALARTDCLADRAIMLVALIGFGALDFLRAEEMDTFAGQVVRLPSTRSRWSSTSA